jgi:hypothetical protein
VAGIGDPVPKSSREVAGIINPGYYADAEK